LFCDNPQEYKHTTVVFQPSSASPSDPEFEQGKEYYFISKLYFFYVKVFLSKIVLFAHKKTGCL